MSGVETIGWRDDVSCIEHTPKQLSHECTILTCLFGQFFPQDAQRVYDKQAMSRETPGQGRYSARLHRS